MNLKNVCKVRNFKNPYVYRHWLELKGYEDPICLQVVVFGSE